MLFFLSQRKNVVKEEPSKVNHCKGMFKARSLSPKAFSYISNLVNLVLGHEGNTSYTKLNKTKLFVRSTVHVTVTLIYYNFM